MTTLREIITGSLRLIRVVGANEEPSAEDMQVALESLQGMLDSMGTDLLNIYTINPYRFLFTAGAEKYTLGPAVDAAGVATGANWVIERPMRVEKAVLLQEAEVTYPTSPYFPPTLTEPTTANAPTWEPPPLSRYSLEVGATTDITGGVMYVAATTGPAPTTEQVISGQVSGPTGSYPVTTVGANSSELYFSTSGTYNHYHVQVANNEVSNLLISAPFVIPGPPPPPLSYIGTSFAEGVPSHVLNIPAHQAGDRIVLYLQSGIAMPTVPSGWTNVLSFTPEFGYPFRVVTIVDTTNTINSITLVGVNYSASAVFRGDQGIGATVIGPNAPATNSRALPTLSLLSPSSLVLAGVQTNNTSLASINDITSPTGMFRVQAIAGPMWNLQLTSNLVSTFSDKTVTWVPGAGTYTTAWAIEIRG